MHYRILPRLRPRSRQPQLSPPYLLPTEPSAGAGGVGMVGGIVAASVVLVVALLIIGAVILIIVR